MTLDEKINGSERGGKGLRKRRDLGEYYRGSHSAEKGLSDCGTEKIWFQQLLVVAMEKLFDRLNE
ncbi:unnamed protein product [Sphenostylis stenocarpa]|uniref:Uncharacterized protein n=1 Tax=Sphenostylis stenocarpa TaxID=92480 RepID=A0AA87B9N5_9FABA|nr:unnamed protein product [Sphenostylis stenocarpa]